MDEKEKKSLLLRIELQETFMLYIVKAGIPALIGSFLYYYAFSSVLDFLTSLNFTGTTENNALSNISNMITKTGKMVVLFSSFLICIHIIIHIVRNSYIDGIVKRKWKQRLREKTENLTFSSFEQEYIYTDMKKEYQNCKKELGVIKEQIKKRNTDVVSNIKETFSETSKERLSCSVCSYPIQIENGKITSSCQCRSIQSFQIDQKKTTVS